MQPSSVVCEGCCEAILVNLISAVPEPLNMVRSSEPEIRMILKLEMMTQCLEYQALGACKYLLAAQMFVTK
jgi:hypothetical protein